MSSHFIGGNHDSDEVVALKEALSNKENQYVTTANQLSKKQEELHEFARTHNEVLQKLQREADQRVQLESALATVQQNFNDERTRRLNVEVSLSNTANDVKEKERSAKELLAHLNRLSAQEGELKATHASLQKENKRLLNRVEELEVNNQHLGRSINAPRPRSTVDDDRAGYLQVQLEELQESHRRQGAELRSTAERLQRAQTQVTQSENEGLAAQKKLRAELQRVQEALEEKDEELAYLRNHAGADSDRERQLLSRIEDEEVKVQTLEFTIRQQAEELRSKGNADRLVRSAEKRAETEARKVEELQNQLSRLRDDLSRADERVDKESHTVSDLSAQLSELQRTHRGVVQEKTTLASRTHELEEENALLRQHRSSSSNEAANLERLLVSIDRIRGERDEVKRQLEFLEMEHKFTQQQLDQERSRAQLDQSRSVDALHSTTSRNIHHLRTIRRLERRADAFVAIFNHAQTQRDSSESTAQTLIEQLDHLREKHIHDVQGLQAEAQQFREDLGHAHEELDDTREALAQAQQDLDESMCSLEEVTTQRRELNLRLYDAQGDLTDGHSFIKELELQLEATQQELAGVVSERDSLRVHAGNLDQEVGAIKAELAEAEQRYSMLQAQQLATMSAEALPKRLKAQLQELEERLARRTKEKENLVHDVKRLETNMRLQEERLGEITAELETAQMENKAMVEDCETTRESRDDALRRVDDLEVDIDALEVQVADSDSKLRYAEASWQTRVTGLLLALADAATKSRTMSRAWKGALDRRDQGLDGLSTRLQQAEEENVRLWGTSRTAETRRAEAAGAAQQMAYELQALQKEVLEGSEDLRNTVLALTLSHQHQRHQQSLVYDFQNARTTMRSRIDTLQRSLDDHRARLVVATEQLKDAQRLRGDSDALRARHAELQTTVARLEQELSEMEAVVNHKVDELAARTATHNALSDQVAELTDDKARLASNLEAAVQSHAEEAKELQDRLSAASMEIDSLRQSDDLERQLADLRSEHDTALRSLQADLDRALERATETDTCLRQATDAREQIEQELARIRQEHEQHIEDMTTDTHAMLALRAELSDLRTHHEARIAEAKEAADVASAGMGELEASLHEAERVRAELQERYAQSEQSLQASLSELEVSNAALRAENDTKEMQLGQAAMSDRQWSEKLQESQDTVMRLSSEANQLQSTQESLNITIAEKEQAVTDLLAQLSELQESLAQATRAQYEAEKALSAHAQRLAALETEVATKASIEQDLRELKEQYDEQVSRAQQMLRDIEANDDHLMTLKKERDASERKAAALMRKNDKLQVKLDAALAAPAPTPVPAPVPAPVPSAPAPPVAAAPSRTSQLPPSTSEPLMQPSHQHYTPLADPSTSSRAKTPEARRPSAPRAKTPDVGLSSKDSPSMAGKKRPLPADFEECDSVPPQAFTPDSVPMGSGGRPRVAPSHRGGFTPARHHPHDPTSPARASNAILDVTNSPRGSSKNARDDKKRGWLPKSRAPDPPTSRSAAPRR